MIQHSSLSQTVDVVNEVPFTKQSISAEDATEVAHWIATFCWAV